MLTLTMAKPCPTSSEKPEGSCRSQVQEELRHRVMIYLLLSLRVEGGLEIHPVQQRRGGHFSSMWFTPFEAALGFQMFGLILKDGGLPLIGSALQRQQALPDSSHTHSVPPLQVHSPASVPICQCAFSLSVCFFFQLCILKPGRA